MSPKFYRVDTPHGLHYRAESESPDDPTVLERAKRWAEFEDLACRPFLARDYSPSYYRKAAEVSKDKFFFFQLVRAFGDGQDEEFSNWKKTKKFFYKPTF